MEIKYKNKAIYFPQEKILVLSDLHIGLEDTLIDQGISFPFKELRHLKKDFKAILSEFNAKKIIYNGDILHRFSGIPPNVPEKLKELTKLPNGEQIFIRGSHDTMLDSIIKDLGYSSRRQYNTNKLLITHGDKLLEKKKPKDYEYLIIGHEHPSIEIHGEKKDCFLINKECIDKTNIIVLPSFSKLSEGVKINKVTKKDFMSPYLRNCSIENFNVVIETKEDVLKFPKLKKFRRKL